MRATPARYNSASAFSGSRCDCLAEEAHRLVRTPAPHADDAELRHGWHVAGIELQDASVAGCRRVEIFAEESQVAQPAEGFDVIGHELQHLLAGRGGFIG